MSPQTIGTGWLKTGLKSGRSALLRVPSALARQTTNVLLNPLHPDARLARVVDLWEYPFDLVTVRGGKNPKRDQVPAFTYTGLVPKLLEEIYRLQTGLTALDGDEQRLLKMCANLLESHYEVKKPRNRLTVEEYEKMPGRWELFDGMLQDY